MGVQPGRLPGAACRRPLTNWDTFLSRAQDALQCRNPNVRNTFITDDIHSVAADPQVTSAQRADLFLKLVSNCPLQRERESKLAMRRAGASLLRGEASMSPTPLVATEMVQRIDDALRSAMDELGDAPLVRHSARKTHAGLKRARLHSWVCVVLHALLQFDSEAHLRASKHWSSLVYTLTQVYSSIYSAVLGLHTNKLCQAVGKVARRLVYRNRDHTLFLLTTLQELVERRPFPIPVLTSFSFVFQACLRLDTLPGAKGIGHDAMQKAKPALLKLYTKWVLCADADVPSHASTPFRLLLCTVVTSNDLDEHVLPTVKETLMHAPKVGFAGASKLVRESRFDWNHRTNGLVSHHDVSGEIENVQSNNTKRALLPYVMDAIYPAVVSNDEGIREEVHWFLKQYRYTGEEGRVLLDTVLSMVRPNELCSDTPHDSFYNILQSLPVQPRSVETLAQCIEMEQRPRTFELARDTIVDFLERSPPGSELPSLALPTFLSNLQSPNAFQRILMLSGLAKYLLFQICNMPLTLNALKKNVSRHAIFIDQILPEIELRFAQSQPNATTSWEAALEACLALQSMIWISASRCNESVKRNDGLFQGALRVRPKVSFLLDPRVARSMHNAPFLAEDVSPFTLTCTLAAILVHNGTMPLHDPEVLAYMYGQLREQLRVPQEFMPIVEFSDCVFELDPALGVQIINKMAQMYIEEGRPIEAEYNLMVSPVYSKGLRRELPRLLVSSHVIEDGDREASGLEMSRFEYTATAEDYAGLDLSKDIPARLDEYLAEIEAARHIPVFQDAASRAYATVLRYGGDAMISRMKSRM